MSPPIVRHMSRPKLFSLSFFNRVFETDILATAVSRPLQRSQCTCKWEVETKIMGSSCNCDIVQQPFSEIMRDSKIGETTACSVCIHIWMTMIDFTTPYVVVFRTYYSIKGLDRWRHCLESGRWSVYVLRTNCRCLSMKPIFLIQQDKWSGSWIVI